MVYMEKSIYGLMWNIFIMEQYGLKSELPDNFYWKCPGQMLKKKLWGSDDFVI
jgi:hypothetical protein